MGSVASSQSTLEGRSSREADGLWQGHPALPVVALALLGTLSALVYGVVIVHPAGLLQWWGRPLVDLYGLAQQDPGMLLSLVSAFVALGALYLLAWLAARAARGEAAWVAVAGGFLVSAGLLLFLYPYDAADLFDYILHGRILGVHGANPFLQVGADFPGDPFRTYAGWVNFPTAYGPLWVLPTGALAALAGDGIVANVIAFKLLVGAYLAGSIGLVAAILRRVAPERALAGVLLLAWNPLVLYETLGHGHNDIAVAFWILAATWALVCRRYALSILALAAGALTKYIPVLLIPAAGAIALRDLPGQHARRRFLLTAGLGGILLVVAAYAPFWHGIETLGVGLREGLYTASLPAFFFVLLSSPLGEGAAAQVISLAAAGLTGLFALWQAGRAWQERSWWSFPQAALHILAFYLLLACLWFQQWYAVWLVGLAALLPPGGSAFFGIAFGFAVLVKPLILEPLWLWIRPFPDRWWREVRLGPAVMATPWLLALGAMVHDRWRGAHPSSPSPFEGRGKG